MLVVIAKACMNWYITTRGNTVCMSTTMLNCYSHYNISQTKLQCATIGASLLWWLVSELTSVNLLQHASELVRLMSFSMRKEAEWAENFPWSGQWGPLILMVELLACRWSLVADAFFLWQILHHNILTWDNLQKRGFEGPGYYCLCGQHLETMQHILISCAFSTHLWNAVANNFQRTNLD